MPCDLIVNTIFLPPPFPGPVDTPCPTQVTVVVQNIGSTTAHGAFIVRLDVLDAVETHPLAFFESVQNTDERGLAPGKVLKVTFDLSFPCASSVLLRATADATKLVTDNLRTKPDSTLPVALSPRPWLVTSVTRLGLRDSGGIVSWDPVDLCPGGALVIEAEVRNAGCAAAAASLAEMQLFEAGNPAAIGKAKQMVPAIQPGGMHALQFLATLPGTPGVISVHVCADATSVVTGQCSPTRLCDSRTASVGAAASPSATLSIKNTIVPGERPVVSWQLRNTCVEFGLITGRVLFAGTELHKSQGLTIGLRTSGGEPDRLVPVTPAVPPTAVAAGLWTVGTKPLDLVVEGSAPGVSPVPASAPLTVVLETVGPGWWSWSSPPVGSTFPWKGSYALAGTFMNLGQSRLTVNAIALREHDVAMPDATTDVLRPATQSLGPLVAGATLPVPWPPFTQTWNWFDFVSMLPVGPLSKTFDYTAEYTLQDDFGNAYALVSSGTIRVVVPVSQAKFYFAFTSYMGQLVGTALLVMAALAAAGVITIIGAAALAGAAGTAFTIALSFRALAGDPPFADFDYDELVPLPERSVNLARLGAELPGTRSLLELVNRVALYAQALSRIEGKVIGAQVDGRLDSARRQGEAYARTMEMLKGAADALPAAAAEATDELGRLLDSAGERLPREIDQLRSGRVSDDLRKVWSLTDQPPSDVENLPAIVNAQELPPLPELLQRFADSAARAAGATLAEATEASSRMPRQG